MNEFEFEFDPPEELTPWLEYQKEKFEQERNFGFTFHILVNGKIKKATSQEWSKWFDEGRVIDKTDFDDCFVSTVCLGLDHNFSFDHPPILFETMIFGGKHDQFQWRYSTYGQAKQGHRDILKSIREDTEPEMSTGQPGFWHWFREMFD